MSMNINVWISSCDENKLFKGKPRICLSLAFQTIFNNTLLWLLKNTLKILMIDFRIIVMVERWTKESWKTKEYVPFQKINTMWPLRFSLTVMWCDLTFKHYQWNKPFVIMLSVLSCRKWNIFQRNKLCRYSYIRPVIV